ncbi:hypothetical protein BU14_0573s0001 [Porphyra umbilicalis]|uniref:Uncharacterized protein n=1 Tax=Porphyra umbilicalis TaxID=2786 RepID=A0A1X6NRN6_PORUM|nr:hypothetical protein BU14_0573s0001 [Porphyra umbilicalis]|eukprot:OSX71245.1 hypothetical protein BU14_0573s0001 [Porphyra umbilicalis]
MSSKRSAADDGEAWTLVGRRRRRRRGGRRGGGRLRRAYRRAPVLRLLARLPGWPSPPAVQGSDAVPRGGKDGDGGKGGKGGKGGQGGKISRTKENDKMVENCPGGDVRLGAFRLGSFGGAAQRDAVARGGWLAAVAGGARRDAVARDARSDEGAAAGGPAAPEGTTVVRRGGGWRSGAKTRTRARPPRRRS